MAQPNIPPEIARRLAEMAKQAPARRPSPAAPAPAPVTTGRWPVRLAAVGWLMAFLAAGVAVGEYHWFTADKQKALSVQAAAYEAQLAKFRSEADAALAKTRADAEASQQILKTELDFEKQPALPLKLVFRHRGVLYVENEEGAPFSCRVRLTRPVPAMSKEYSFTVNARAFRDLGAIEDWVFARGDRVEFFKPGYKPWTGVFP